MVNGHLPGHGKAAGIAGLALYPHFFAKQAGRPVAPSSRAFGGLTSMGAGEGGKMVVIQVPHRRYERAVKEMDRNFRSAWAFVDIRPGRSWGLYKDPWEPIERLWLGEDVLRALQQALAGGGNGYA